MNIIKKYGNGILLIGLAVFFYFLTGLNKGCGGGKTVTDDTTYIRDTIRLVKDSAYPVYVPRPYPVPGKEVQLPPEYINLPADTAALNEMINDLAKRHYAVNTYNDSFNIIDSFGDKVAIFRLKDTVSENLIQARAPGYTVTTTKYKDTVRIIRQTITQPVFQGYWGLGLISNFKKVTGASAGVIFKDKKDRITQFKVGGIYHGGKVEPQIEATKYFKIKL